MLSAILEPGVSAVAGVNATCAGEDHSPAVEFGPISPGEVLGLCDLRTADGGAGLLHRDCRAALGPCLRPERTPIALLPQSQQGAFPDGRPAAPRALWRNRAGHVNGPAADASL